MILRTDTASYSPSSPSPFSHLLSRAVCCDLNLTKAPTFNNHSPTPPYTPPRISKPEAPSSFIALRTSLLTTYIPAMASIRRMTPTDLFSLNLTNLDALTENYDLHFYLNYLMRWPSLFNVVEDRNGQIVGYSMRPPLSPHPPTPYLQITNAYRASRKPQFPYPPPVHLKPSRHTK